MASWHRTVLGLRVKEGPVGCKGHHSDRCVGTTIKKARKVTRWRTWVSLKNTGNSPSGPTGNTKYNNGHMNHLTYPAQQSALGIPGQGLGPLKAILGTSG
jgi:hypothetical protein